MSNRLAAKIGIALVIAVAVFLFRVALAFYSSSRFSLKAKLLTTAIIFLSLYGGFVVYPEESAFYKAKRLADSDLYELTHFQRRYPSSHRIGEIDDLLWKATSGPKSETALYLYKEYFQFGRHKDELKQRLARKKQDELTEIRTHPDLKKSLNFLSNYRYDPEAAEARDILLSVLERLQTDSKASPRPALFQKLIHSGDGKTVTYSVEMADSDCPNSSAVRSPIIDRLNSAIEAFHLRAQAMPSGGSIRARAACVVEKSASYGDSLAHGEVVAAQLALYLPGESRPAWTEVVTARSPERISGLSKNSGRNQEVVTEKTADELKTSLKPSFRYWF